MKAMAPAKTKKPQTVTTMMIMVVVSLIFVEERKLAESKLKSPTAHPDKLLSTLILFHLVEFLCQNVVEKALYREIVSATHRAGMPILTWLSGVSFVAREEGSAS